MEISVLTYNIHHGKGTDKQVNLYRIAEVIEQSGADIIGLNEVDKYFSKRSKYKDQISWLAEQLNMDHAFAPSLSLKSKDALTVRQYGNALLSRYPILSKKVYPFDLMARLIESRSLLDATIQINEKVIQMNVTHLSLNPFLHRMQINFMVSQIYHYSWPVIVMGDFNMKPASGGWNRITREFHDTWHVSDNGEGATYPTARPRSRLDYIFASPEVEVIGTEVVTILPQASDHLPVKVQLRI